MFKRLLRPLLEPLAAKLDKLLNRTSEGFKKQQERQSETREKQSERMNMLSRQIDDSRDEIIRGFARQEAKLNSMKRELDEVMHRLNKLGTATSGRAAGGMVSMASTSPDAPTASAPEGKQSEQTEPSENPVAEMMLDAGGTWLASQANEREKA
ncbi:hypothetical protein [Roseimicrobium sp. ORNL1]|uniref:hypothetical protein n=1 Tax=Roseimicrobium sp. ORNL1 TaxID=2711231 RepID=UPI0013E15A34|nr:hypothetical protein [Roseimicrobium sp. ORNL1]QIF01597.1 hypothetical protein G5S37_08695 [Roseimicrobium sp. ORNL1]